MAASGTLVIRFIGDLKEFERATASMSKKLTSTGTTLTKSLTLPLVGAGIAAGKTAMDFEKSMSLIQGLVGASEKQIKRYSKVILTEGPKWGKAPQELADALYFVTSSGFQGAKALDILKKSAKGSTAGLGETGQIADLLTSAMNAYRNKNLSAAQSVDVLAKAIEVGKLESSELAGVMGQVLPVASNMGVEFHEVGAALSAMSMSGTDASEGTTQLRGILSSLLKPTVEAEKQLRSMGLSSAGLRDQIEKKGLLSVLETLTKKFGGNEAAAAKVFGNVRALTGVMNMMGGNVDQTRKIFSEMENATGSADRAFAAASKTAEFKLNKAMASIKATMVVIGADILPYVARGLEVLSGWLSKASAGWDGLSPAVKRVALMVAAAAAAIGPFLLVLGKVMLVVSKLTPHIRLVMLAVAALVAVFTAARDKTSTFGEAVAKIAGFFTNPKFLSAVESVRQALARFASSVGGTLRKVGGDIAAALVPAFAEISRIIRDYVLPAFAAILPIVTPVVNFLLKMLGSAVVGAIRGVMNVITGLVEVIAGAFKLVKALVTGDWSAAWDAVKQIVGGALKAIVGAVEAWFNLGILAIFRQGIKAVLSHWKDFWGGIKSGATSAFNAVRGFIDNVWAAIGRIFKDAIAFIGGKLTSAFTAFRSTAHSVWTGVQSAVSTAWSAIRGVFVAVKDFLTHPLSSAFSAFKGAADAAWTGLKNIVGDLWRNQIKGVFEAIQGWVGKEGHLASAFKAGVAAIADLWGGLREVAAKPVRFVVNTIYNDGLRKMIGALPGVSAPPAIRLPFATGGPVRGPGTETSDSIPAWLSRNEFVVKASVAKKVMPFLQALNSGRLGFAEGGPVWPTTFRSLSNTYAGHTGVDISLPGSADYGLPIFASHAGRAVASYAAGSYGNYVRVYSPQGYSTIYGHMASPGYSGPVRAGQMIGRIGSTGNSSGPHLHFEVRPGGTYASALAFLNGASSPKGGGGGGFFDFIGDLVGTAKKVAGWIGGMGKDGWPGIIRQAAFGLGGQLVGWINGKVPGPGPIPDLFDRGGMLRHGALAANLSGSPERVLDPRTTRNFESFTYAMNELARARVGRTSVGLPGYAGGGADGGGAEGVRDITVQITAPSSSPHDIARATALALRMAL